MEDDFACETPNNKRNRKRGASELETIESNESDNEVSIGTTASARRQQKSASKSDSITDSTIVDTEKNPGKKRKQKARQASEDSDDSEDSSEEYKEEGGKREKPKVNSKAASKITEPEDNFQWPACIASNRSLQRRIKAESGAKMPEDLYLQKWTAEYLDQVGSLTEEIAKTHYMGNWCEEELTHLAQVVKVAIDNREHFELAAVTPLSGPFYRTILAGYYLTGGIRKVKLTQTKIATARTSSAQSTKDLKELISSFESKCIPVAKSSADDLGQVAVTLEAKAKRGAARGGAISDASTSGIIESNSSSFTGRPHHRTRTQQGLIAEISDKLDVICKSSNEQSSPQPSPFLRYVLGLREVFPASVNSMCFAQCGKEDTRNWLEIVFQSFLASECQPEMNWTAIDTALAVALVLDSSIDSDDLRRRIQASDSPSVKFTLATASRIKMPAAAPAVPEVEQRRSASAAVPSMADVHESL